MGGRLVHEEQVRRVEQQLDQRQSAFLAAAEHADRLERIVAPEQEAAQHRARGLLADRHGHVLRLLENRVPLVEHFHAVLRVIAHLHVAAHEALPALDGHDARQDFEQRRFARAVGTDEHDLLAALGGEVHALVNLLTVRVRLIDVFERHDLQAATLGLGKTELHRGGLGLGHLQSLHAGDLLELALGLTGEAGLGAETVGETLETFDLALLRLVGVGLLLAAGGALREVAVIVAPVEKEVAVADLGGALRKLVQKLAVVRDHQDRAGIPLQILLEPAQDLQIEVVGRLVEHQQIRLLGEQPREVGAHDPAAAERARGFFKIRLLERQSLQDALGLWFKGMSGVFVLGVRGGQGKDGFVARRGALLRQEAQRGAPVQDDTAFVRRVFLEDEREQRRFPRAVGTDQADALAPVDLQGGVAEESASRVGFGEIGKCEHGSRKRRVLYRRNGGSAKTQEPRFKEDSRTKIQAKATEEENAFRLESWFLNLPPLRRPHFTTNVCFSSRSTWFTLSCVTTSTV